MKLNIRQVEAFRAAVSMQSMSGAADLLGISQPAVSRLIGDFQKAVGMKLFTRTRTGMVPTQDARQLYDHVEKLFMGFEELGHHVESIKSLNEGHLTIAATSSYCTGILPELIAAFKAEHPSIHVALHILPHDEVIDWVVAGRADLGLTSQKVARVEVDVIRLEERPMVAVFPAGHRFESMKQLTPRDFHGETFVSFPRGSAPRFQIDHLFNAAGVERTITTEATSHHAVCALVRAGLGVALVNPFAPFASDGKPVPTRPVTPSVMMELTILLPQRDRAIVTMAFHDYLLGHAPARLRDLLQ